MNTDNKKKAEILFKKGTSFYNKKMYHKAYPYYRDALLLHPQNVLYICDFCCCADMIGEYDRAFVGWRKILRCSEKKIMSFTGKSIKNAKSFKNDCLLRISITYSKLMKDGLAKRYLTNYLHNINKEKLETIFTKEYLLSYKNDLNY